MAVYTIDDIDKKVDEKFEPTEIDLGESGVARMLHPIRLPDDRTARFKELMAEFRDLEKRSKKIEQSANEAKAAREAADAAADGDKKTADRLERAAVAAEKKAEEAEAESDALMKGMNGVLGELLRAVLADPRIGDDLLKVADTLERRMAVLELYMQANQAGEASPSPS